MFNRYFTERNMYACSALAVLVLFLAGCGGGNSSSASVTNSISNPGSTATMGPTSASVTLKHQPSGTATLTWDHTTRMLTAQFMLTGLAPNSTHPVHIGEGNCTSTGSSTDRMLYSLANVVADAHGVVNTTSKISVPDGIPAKNWHIEIHNGPGLTTANQSLSLVCGDVVNPNPSLKSMQTVQVALQTQSNDKSQQASGNATLTLSGHTLTVELTLTGLEPNSQHMAHIHSGSCASQGPVVYNLTVVKADASGKSTTTTVIQNVNAIPASGWYINVHYGTDLSTQTGFDPIACGDVVVNN
jgi:Cu/Zn superoxide dismutase